jgi:hypothetical protein
MRHAAIADLQRQTAMLAGSAGVFFAKIDENASIVNTLIGVSDAGGGAAGTRHFDRSCEFN